MKNDENRSTGFKFKIDEKIKARALEVLGESQAMQYAEGLRIGGALTAVFGREHARRERKYGKDHTLTLQVAARAEVNAELKKSLFARYTDASTPQSDPGEGWAVDGFVRTADGEPVEDVTVAAYDRQGRRYRELGHGCSDKQGYFSMIAEKIPDKELRVYIRASYGEKMLKSSENRLTPIVGGADRIEIIITDTSDKGDCMPPSGKKGADYSPGGSSRGKDVDPPPVKEVPKEKSTGGSVDPEITKKVMEAAKGKLKEEPKINIVGNSKKVIPKKRGK